MRIFYFIRDLTLILMAMSQSVGVYASTCLAENKVGGAHAHEASQRVIDAFKAKDASAIADLMSSYMSVGPSSNYVRSTAFDELFSEEYRNSILALEGTSEQCWGNVYKGFAMGRGILWFNDAAEIITLHTQPIKVATPEAKNTFWQSAAGPIHPNCLYYPWISGDNLKTVTEHFGIADWWELYEEPGKFFGSFITDFDLIETEWDDPKALHIGFKTQKCAASQSGTELDQDKGVTSHECNASGDCARSAYKLLRTVSLDVCTSLALNFSGDCRSAYLVQRTEDSDVYHIIYGLFDSEKHGEVIFPLLNFDTKAQADQFFR